MDLLSSAPVLLNLNINAVVLIYIPFLTRVRNRVSKSKVISIDDCIFDGRRGPTRHDVASRWCAVPVP